MKSKYLFFFMLAIFIVIQLGAVEIDLMKAQKAGSIHLDLQKEIWSSQISQGLLQNQSEDFYIIGSNPVIDEINGNTLFYVLDLHPKGFIVVSANTKLEPIIAYSYSDNFSFDDVSTNLLLQLLKKDINQRLSITSNLENNPKWETLVAGDVSQLNYSNNIEQWPPVGHSQYNNGWLNMDIITPTLEQIVTYWQSPSPLQTTKSTKDMCTELHENWQYNSAQKVQFSDSTSFYANLIDNMRRGWPVQLALQIENSDKIDYITCDGYCKTGSGVNYYHLKLGGEWGTWYELEDINQFIIYGIMNIHPTDDLHEPNNNRHDAYPIQDSEFTDNNGIWNCSAGTKLESSQECDWYRFEAKAGETISITFRGNTNESEEVIALYANDALLMKQEIIGNNENEEFSYPISNSGTYYVAIGNKDTLLSSKEIKKELNIDAQPYNLSVVKIIDPEIPVPNLLTVELKDPIQYTVNDNSYAYYRAEAYFDDNSTADVTTLATWTDNSSYAYFSSSVKGKLITLNVLYNQTISITAAFTYNGRTRYANQTVLIKQSPLSDLTIEGLSSVAECTSHTYTATAHFTDGDSVVLSSGVTWSENSSYATISGTGSAVLTTSAVCCNKIVIITASYTYNGITKTAQKTVTIYSVGGSVPSEPGDDDLF